MAVTALSYTNSIASPPPVVFAAGAKGPHSLTIQLPELPSLHPALRELGLMLLAAIITSATFVGLGVLCGVLGLL